jgi:preprotein translocase subunit YajC
MEFLNNYSGLFALLALLVSVVVPFWIYHMQQVEERHELQDELEMLNKHDAIMTNQNIRQRDARKECIKRRLRRM